MANEVKKNYKDMMLQSEHGYMMPYAMSGDDRLEVMLGYGEQTHPRTGEKFHHNGVDLSCKSKELYAVADGLVIGAGQDAVHENYIVSKYGKYEVTYGHVSEAYMKYGTSIQAGQVIAKSGDFLHMGVTFDGRQMDPMMFLGMLFQDVQLCAAQFLDGMQSPDVLGDVKIHTNYDKDTDEILMMMLRWLPNYFAEISRGSYAPSDRMQNSLRNIFAQSADKNYLYETAPSIANPLGITSRAAPLVEKVENILIGDFLNYMAMRHGRFLSSWDDSQKKNFLLTQKPAA